MNKAKGKNKYQFRKAHGGLSIVAFLILMALAGVCLVYFMATMAEYVIQTKLEAEYRSIAIMARLYDAGRQAGQEENLWSLLDTEGREYLIRSADGDVLHQSGVATCEEEGRSVYLMSLPDPIAIYKDTRYPFLYGTDRQEIFLDVPALFRFLRQNGSESLDLLGEAAFLYDDEIPAPHIEVSVSVPEPEIDEYAYGLQIQELTEEQRAAMAKQGGSSFIHLPVWMGIPVADGSRIFLAKAGLDLKISDLSVLSISVFIFLGLALFLCVLFFFNVISRIRNQRRAMKMYFTDIITSGHNRTWFLYNGDRMLRKRSNASYAYAAVHLVFVKYRTYVLCHSVSEGEAILTQIYRSLERHLGKKEICAHCSPGEYALLLRVSDEASLKERIRGILQDLGAVDPNHTFTYQIGVDLLPPERDRSGKIVRRRLTDLEQAYNNAGTARGTLESKEDTGIAFFDSALAEERKWQDQVEEHMRTALEREEFQVYYQPKYDPQTHTLRGAEALIRWQSPDFGFVSPGRFIPIFEKNGFITEIDHYMLSHVAADQKRWLDQGLACVPVSVNVSRAHFIESDLAEQIRDLVDSAGTPRELIEIELTESAFFDDKNALLETIRRLKEYGFAVSMDDFGSGYSSLNSLKDMPLDVLKIDAEFFRGENAGERGEIVVSETIRLAQSLHMRTVAEGVELKEQVDFLAEQGCDMIQGYYFAKPMPKNEFETKMAAG